MIGKILERQVIHMAIYGALGALLYRVSQGDALVLLSWIFAGLMQAWIAAGWRLELHLGKLSAWFGDRAFRVFQVGFVLFALPRMLLVIPISAASPGTSGIPMWVRLSLIGLTTPFILWGAISFLLYFGISRAMGADHFDHTYRGAPLVTRGLFRYVPNVGYAVVLLALYHPALLYDSALGLLTAAAHHALVWTHYFCTERPDMRAIYAEEHLGQAHP